MEVSTLLFKHKHQNSTRALILPMTTRPTRNQQELTLLGNWLLLLIQKSTGKNKRGRIRIMIRMAPTEQWRVQRNNNNNSIDIYQSHRVTTVHNAQSLLNMENWPWVPGEVTRPLGRTYQDSRAINVLLPTYLRDFDGPEWAFFIADARAIVCTKWWGPGIF